MSCCCGDEEDEPQIRPEATRVRGCTDVFWLCIFIMFWFLMIVIAAFAFVYGNPIRLINGYDSFGNTCGVKDNMKIGTLEPSGQDTSDKPYLFFHDVAHIKKSLKICVKKCPDQELRNDDDVCNFYERTGSKLCIDKTDYRFCKNRFDKNLTRTCPKYPVYTSKPILNRCIPHFTDATKVIVSNFYDLLNSWDFIEQVLADLYKTWREIIVLSCLSFVLSLVMIAIYHWMASFVTWIVMTLVVVASLAGTSLLWWTYFDIKKKLDHTNPEERLIESLRNERAFFVLAVIATVITIILIFLICFVRKHISFMTVLFKESAKCLGELPGLFFTAPVTFATLLVFFSFWVTVIVCLATANYTDTKDLKGYDALNLNSSVTARPTEETTKVINSSFYDFKSFTLVDYTNPTWVKYMWWVYLIGLIWVSEFIVACQTMVISGAVAHWYFRGKNASMSPVCSSLGTLITYHLGTVACGSFLITLFKIPRLILTYLHMKFEKTKETSPCSQCGLKCCICCFYCLEKFIRYMNHNAYTVVAIEGTNFCNAARIAFNTLLSNAVQVAVINGIGDFILFMGKCFVTAATGSIGLLYMRDDPRLHFYAVPIFFICVFAFFIAHCVISLYETVIDTLFLCICEDKNLHGENGKWRSSALAQLGTETTTNGQSQEMSPMNS